MLGSSLVNSPFAAAYSGVFGDGPNTGPVFGLGTDQQVDDLNKALSVGYQYPPTSGADALRMESLENTLHVVTYSLKNIKLWPDIPKKPAFSTVESYDQLTSYGDGAGIFNAGGQLPLTQDSTYLRKIQQVKFTGIVGEVTHPTTLVNTPFGDLIGLETQNKAIRLVQGIETALFNGRSDINALEWDGLYKQLLDGVYGTTSTPVFDPWNNPPVQPNNSVVVDLRGGSLTEDLVEYGANHILEAYDEPTDMYLTTRARSDLTKQMYPRERIALPVPTDSGKVGYAVKMIETSAGDVKLNSDVFLRPGYLGVKTAPAAATSTQAPTAPTAVSTAAASDGSGQSIFSSADAATYIYTVTAINQYGESTGFTTGGVAVTAGQKVTLTITDGGGTYPSTGYKIYRTAVGAPASQGPIVLTTLPRTTLAGTGVFVDYNFYLPGCSRAYLIPKNDRFFAFKQLCPMVRIPLATIAISVRWAQMLYGTPCVYAPQRGIVYINVKDQ
jgi:hypothetical protein